METMVFIYSQVISIAFQYPRNAKFIAVNIIPIDLICKYGIPSSETFTSEFKIGNRYGVTKVRPKVRNGLAIKIIRSAAFKVYASF